mmetsp:Transcript_39326/g.91188  ORF Transcript_39326/g.91188 Transcript_39326/m.91188 type:complete len:202 (+) Transcript_39326:293-898(+)
MMRTDSASMLTWFSLTFNCRCNTRLAVRKWFSPGRRLLPGSRLRTTASVGSPPSCCSPSTQTSVDTTSVSDSPLEIFSTTTSTMRATRPSDRRVSEHLPIVSSLESSVRVFALPFPKIDGSTPLVFRYLPKASRFRPMGAGTKLQSRCSTVGAESFTFLRAHSSSVSHERNLVLRSPLSSQLPGNWMWPYVFNLHGTISFR